MRNKLFLTIMAKEVIKVDGSRAPFDAGKVRKSIEAAAADVGLSAEETSPIIKQVFGAAMKAAAAKPEIATSELKDVILGELDKAKPEMSAAWRKHDETKDRS